MFSVVPFHVDHIKDMLSHSINKQFTPLWTKDNYFYPQYVAQNSDASTLIVNGVPLACAFIVELWEKRGYLVVILSEEIKTKGVGFIRGVHQFLKNQPYDRLEMDVPCDMELAHRRARMLGFHLEIERARKYLPNGQDASVYAWVRE